ncbi:MAG: class I adenylate-forming enzyme family protein [Acidimicrobiales bacterium]
MRELVAIDLPGGSDFVTELRRAWEAGDAVLPVDQRLGGPARRVLFEALRPGRLVGGDGTTLMDGGRPVDPGDALVMATSGTTGVPKGVVLTHSAVAASAHATSARLQVDPARDGWLACLPLNHVGGLSVVTRALITGTALTVLPGFDAAAVRACAGTHVLVSLVPATLARVGAELFRTVVLGGSAPPGGLAPNVVTTYGLTETGSGVVYDGRPLDGVDTAVDTATGEIRLRGAMLLRAYRDGTVPLDGDGWFATGDSGHWGPDGRLHVDGRLTELIITGGENVWPEPVEALLRGHPGVSDVAVAGRPDPAWGQRVVAWVVPAPGREPPQLAELRDLVRDGLAAYAAPKELVLVDALPRTAIGKLRRSALGATPGSVTR